MVSQLEKGVNMLRMICFLCTLLLVPSVQATEFDHGDWDTLLQEHVRVVDEGSTTQVDYKQFASRRNSLKNYLDRLSSVSRQEFDAWSADGQLAFLINAYNSWTIELILTRYPDLDSIKELGSLFQSPWKKSFIQLLGEHRSLDDIEHKLIRGSGRYNDPRIHFAVNCASIGCPALRAEAYVSADLQRQLDEATALFLSDRSRNRLSGQQLEVSSLFKWYREDFEKGWRSVSSLNQFFSDHVKELGLTETESKQVLSGTITISFLNYDWKLNRIP